MGSSGRLQEIVSRFSARGRAACPGGERRHGGNQVQQENEEG
uniref:Uncharacterized protein n=1 Tax=Arundo donax TaxID=35708 RepID=A0A0A9EJ45_ARUDO